MYLAGQAQGYGATEIYRASLRLRAPLSAAGWNLDARQPENWSRLRVGKRVHGMAKVEDTAPRMSRDGTSQRRWVERIYYAGAAENLWGPYTIGFLQWDGEHWIDQPPPVFTAKEDWEHGSVYEPNLIYHDGKWKMWYVAGSNQEDYLVHGYAESEDG